MPNAFSDTDAHALYHSTYNDRIFSYEEFQAYDFRYCVFNRCTFDHCSIRFCSFEGCTFENCLFMGTALVTANFSDCTFSYVNFDGASLDALAIRQGHFHNSQIVNTRFRRVVMEDTCFSDTHIDRCRGNRLSIHGTSQWMGSDLVLSNFENCVIENTHLSSGFVADNHFLECTTTNFTKVDTLVVYHRNRVENGSHHNSFLMRGRTKKCAKCHESYPPNSLVKGLCRNCYSMKGYSIKNHEVRGKKSKLPSFSFEFEMVGFPPIDEVSDQPHPVDLVKHGFVATADMTVDAEYKSPIYLNNVSFNRVLPLLDSLKQYVDPVRCGTHIHVGTTNSGVLGFDQAEEAFHLMLSHMMRNREETIHFWGRYFGDYCLYNDYTNRHNWLNVDTGHNTIEYRLAVFRNAEQFSNVVRFVRRLTRYIDRHIERRLAAPRTGWGYNLKLNELSKAILVMYTSAVAETERKETANV